jgi:hypothetical protein
MDNGQLATIVVSAIAGALAKEAVGWLINSIKGLSIIPEAYRKLKLLWAGPIGSILTNISNLFFFLGILIYFGMSDGAASRIEIILVVVSIFMVIFSAGAVLFQIGMELERRKKQKAGQKAGYS